MLKYLMNLYQTSIQIILKSTEDTILQKGFMKKPSTLQKKNMDKAGCCFQRNEEKNSRKDFFLFPAMPSG